MVTQSTTFHCTEICLPETCCRDAPQHLQETLCGRYGLLGLYVLAFISSQNIALCQNSLLVEAAIHGHLAVLDGIEALSYGTLNTLQRLVSEREMQLPDGTRLVNAHRYEKLMKKSKMSIEDLDAKRLIPIHPSFRIVALARAGVSGQSDAKAGAWLTAEVLSMFHFIVVDSLPSQVSTSVLLSLAAHYLKLS